MEGCHYSKRWVFIMQIWLNKEGVGDALNLFKVGVFPTIVTDMI
jgi:hypothetical protein